MKLFNFLKDKLMADRIKLFLLSVTASFIPLIIRLKRIYFVGINEAPFYRFSTGIKFNYYDYYKALSIWIIAIGTIIILIYQLKNKEIEFKKNKITFLVFIFIYMGLISTLMSHYINTSLWGDFTRSEGLITYISYIVLFIGASSINLNKVGLNRYISFLAIGVSILSLIGIFQYFGLDLLRTNLNYYLTIPKNLMHIITEGRFNFKFINRSVATLGNPNYVGSYVATVLPLFIGLYIFSSHKKSYYINLLTCNLLFAFLIGSGSRGGMVGLFLALLVLLILNYKRIKKYYRRYIILFISFLLIFTLMNIYGDGFASERISRLLGDIFKLVDFQDENYEENIDTLGSKRGLIWKLSIPMIKETILIGHGPDTYLFYYPQDKSFQEGYYVLVDKPHNLYLQIAINMGLLALIAFIIINLLILTKGYKYLRLNNCGRDNIYTTSLMVSIVGYLTQGLFNDSVVSVAPIYWIHLGLLYSIFNNKQKVYE